jgi:medium-chain acyl-[acyl-carrier-protein] hydrolase
MQNAKHNKWVVPYHRRNPSAAIRLFCFPYAGGGASAFVRCMAQMAHGVEICPVQPPGRENRLSEECLTSVGEVAKAAAEALEPYFDKDFAVFGHSLGAILGFEMLQRLRQTGGPAARHLIVSAHRAPHIPLPHAPTWDLPDLQLRQRLEDLNGTPKGVLDHPELQALMLPLIRADFRLDETYALAPGCRALDCPITVIGGSQDKDVPELHLQEWRRWTNAGFDLKMIEDDHFFIHSQSTKLTAVIADALRSGGCRI